MKLLLIWSLIITVQSATENNKDNERLLGTWHRIGGLYQDADLTKGTYKGHAIPASTLVISKDSWVVELKTAYKPGIERTKLKYVLFSDVMPKRIDLIRGSRVTQGIYKLSDDVLMICLGPTGRAERPKNFDSCVPDGYALLTYKRK